MSRILITGASGFIGVHLAATLAERGREVTCLVRPTSQTDRLRALGVRLAEGDISDRTSLAAAIESQEIVFQLAGCLRAFGVEPLYRVNEEGVRNVAWVCAAQPTPPVLVSVSSLAAVGPSTDQRPRIESDPPAAVSHYGRSKWAGERAVREWADRVPTTIVRPPIVFGQADPATCELFRPVAHLGLHIVPTWRDHRVSLIHVADLVNLLILAAERGKRLVRTAADDQAAAVGCYFAACEQDVSYAQLGRMIGTALGRRRTRVLRSGPAVVWAVAATSTAWARIRRRAAYFNLDKAREARAGSWTCSPAAAVGELGFAVAAPLPQRLQETALWYREHGWL
jgi:nucleoside-diphosphate-sugar epimerase